MKAEPDRVTSRESVIEFRNTGYRLPNGQTLLENVSLKVGRGETLALLGRSGAGKSTALRLINRLLEPSDGEVLVEGKSTRSWDAIALRRHIGYVIQEIGLFPHYTIEQNVSLVPRLEGWPAERTRARVSELLDLVGLDAPRFAKRYPHQLSGGQRQRVGIARALSIDPPILLMDEPFGSVDPLTTGELLKEFQQLQRRLQKTIVIVTHDVDESLMLAARIALLDAGKLTGIYSAKEFLVAREPMAAAYVANFRMYEEAERKNEPH
ncbi:MAG TPA: ATP-binding cassette domain-containing protein [Candidatus Acidoferrales bacterium]|nr:ATP-binding cassette domain-containing protein [Candidatus Acidoferrales bacterium]